MAIVADYTLKCRLAVKEGEERHCKHAVGNDGCSSSVVCMMAYGVKDKEIVFDNYSYLQHTEK
jgi:hypothetical protein